MKIITKSEQETTDFAKKIASLAKPGDIYALKGDLGSGKTVFSKGFLRSFGVEKNITSPTFVIMKKYDLLNNSKVREILHIDCYRFNGPEDALSIGLDEYLQDDNIIMLIEWPEKIWSLVQDRAKLIQFEYLEGDKREISYEI
ncbi:MAG: tRNA (adenosine(37)-N6)-threonylcarbamoyltransferase complex ATPase subunit type 1 TsaE [Candidatus Berkelbacteria bacterium]|nr:tRNA (adenosine(37)-N6)-threonylcarbamoyltransferase complex ATPase subunit type 1 TsaE [Candidatus Berkelbacteria bacterium]